MLLPHTELEYICPVFIVMHRFIPFFLKDGKQKFHFLNEEQGVERGKQEEEEDEEEEGEDEGYQSSSPASG